MIVLVIDGFALYNYVCEMILHIACAILFIWSQLHGFYKFNQTFIIMQTLQVKLSYLVPIFYLI